MKNYIIYARKSSIGEDRQALSIESQIAELSSYAAKAHLPIRDIFTESQSARTHGRPIFLKMLKRIERGDPVAILCWNLDRLTRNLQDAATVSHLLQEGAISEIRTPSRVYGGSSTDLFLTGLDFLIAKKYSDDLSESVKRGLSTKVSMGWRPGLAPLGYANDWNSPKGRRIIKPDPSTWHKVRKLWELLLGGNTTLSKLSEKSQLLGIPLAKSSIYSMLTNQFYYGHFLWNGELHEGKHKPMITFQEFDSAQNILRRPMHNSVTKQLFRYRGLMICGQCGSSITAERKFKRLRLSNRIREYIYYRCTRSKNSSCKQPSMTEKAIEEEIVTYLKAIQIPQERLPLIHEHIDSLKRITASQDKATIEQIKKLLRECDHKLSILLELKISSENESDQLLSNIEYIHKKNTLLQSKAKYQLELSKLQSCKNEISNEIKEMLDFAVNGLKRFTFGDAHEKRKVFSYLNANHVMYEKRLMVTMRKSLQLFLSSSSPLAIGLY